MNIKLNGRFFILSFALPVFSFVFNLFFLPLFSQLFLPALI